MADHVELETDNFEYPSHQEAAGRVYDEYRHTLVRSLGGKILGVTFDAQQAAAELPKEALQVDPSTVISGILAYEKESEKWSPSRLRDVIINQGFSPDSTDLTFAPAFVQDLHDQIATMPRDFSQLEGLRNKVATTPYLEVVQKVWELYEPIADVSPDRDAHRQVVGAATDSAYVIVSEAVNDFDRFALSPEDIDALYLLTFLPDSARTYTRRLLMHASLIADMKQALGELDTDEATMLELVTDYLKMDIIDSGAWDQARRSIPLNEETIFGINAAEQQSIEDRLAIRQLYSESKGERVIEAWQAARKRQQDIVGAVAWEAHTKGASRWSSIDIGHGLHSHAHDLAYRLTTDPENGMKVHTPVVKSGEQALVLEDDHIQMESYLQMIDKRTRFTTTPDLTFSTAEGVLEAAEDPNVQLFVLDTQIGRDNMAGINVALELLIRRTGTKGTRIILWSSSLELVELASEMLKGPVEKAGFNYSLLHSGSSSGRRSHITVQLKGWDSGMFESDTSRSLV